MWRVSKVWTVFQSLNLGEKTNSTPQEDGPKMEIKRENCFAIVVGIFCHWSTLKSLHYGKKIHSYFLIHCVKELIFKVCMYAIPSCHKIVSSICSYDWLFLEKI